MNFLVAFGLLCLVAYSTQVPNYIIDNCDEDKLKNQFDSESCMEVLCKSVNSDNFKLFQLDTNSCPIPFCMNGTYKGKTDMDVSKVYPDCCAKAICE